MTSDPAKAKPVRQADQAIHATLSDESKAFVREAEAKARDRGPNPVPGKKVQDMSIAEQELVEAWIGVPCSTEERWRRDGIRRRQRLARE